MFFIKDKVNLALVNKIFFFVLLSYLYSANKFVTKASRNKELLMLINFIVFKTIFALLTPLVKFISFLYMPQKSSAAAFFNLQLIQMTYLLVAERKIECYYVFSICGSRLFRKRVKTADFSYVLLRFRSA